MLTFLIIFAIIFTVLYFVYKFDKIPDFSKISEKITTSDGEIATTKSKNIIKDNTKERSLRISLDTGKNELTVDDIELRDTLFERHIKHYKVYEGPDGEIKANIPFQAVIFLTRKYSPLVNEFGEIVVSVKAEKDKLLLTDLENDHTIGYSSEDVLEYGNKPIKSEPHINTSAEMQESASQKTIQNKKQEKPETIEETTETSSILGDFSIDDDVDTDALLDALNSEYASSTSLNVEYEEDLEMIDSIKEIDDNPFANFSQSDNEEYEIRVEDADSKEYLDMVFVSKSFIQNDSIIGTKVDFMDCFDLIDENSEKIQTAMVNNLFVEQQVAFLEDKSIFVPLKTFAKAAAMALSDTSKNQIIIEKELKNHKNLATVEDIFSFIFSNRNYVIFKQEGKPFQVLSIKQENGEICKTQGVKLSPTLIKDFLPDEYSKLMSSPFKAISVSDKNAEKFCQ